MPPWQKGQSGNPRGTRKGSHSILLSVRRQLAADPDPETGEGRLAAEIASLAVRALRDALERQDPKMLAAIQPLFQVMTMVENVRTPGELREERIVFLMGGGNRASLEEFVAEQKKALAARTVKAETVQSNGHGERTNGHHPPALP